MTLISKLDDLIDNALYLERQLTSRLRSHRNKSADLVKKGTCFLRYSIDDRVLFAPSRFIGYKNNTISAHIRSRPHGSVTNIQIKKILSREPLQNQKLDNEYKSFCTIYGIKPNQTGNFGTNRKYWDLEQMVANVYGNIELPEGRKMYRRHVLRERNPRVRRIAISNFLQQNGKLFCEACFFDFEKKYGSHGKNFIECHHKIPLSKMLPGHMTRPEDIIILCSNCHRMVHKNKNWLSLFQLRKIIKK